MSVEVHCLLSCSVSRIFRVICYGNTFSELLLAARKAHDVRCHCKPSFCDYACVGSDDPAHFPHPISRRVKLDEMVSDIFDEQSRPVASFVAEEVWRDFLNTGSMSGSSAHAFSVAASSLVDPESPARSKFVDTIPGLNALGQGMLQSSSGHPRVALRNLTAHDLLYSPGVIWADKTACILDLSVESHLLGHKLPLVRRPEGFGKTSFLAMLEFFYDCRHFTAPISDAALKFMRVSDVNPNAPFMVEPHGDLVLTFDLSVPSVKDFRQSLGSYINSVFGKFLWKYQQELIIHPEDIPIFLSEDGTLSFGSVLELTDKQWGRIFIFIDNYNAPSIASGNSAEVHSCLNRMIISPLSKSMSSVRGLIVGTGDAPDPLINGYLRGGCDIWTAVAIDMTDEDMVDATFGFTPEEIHELERHLKVHSVEVGLVPYRFGNQKVYSMSHVLNKISQQLGGSDVDLDVTVPLENLALQTPSSPTGP